MIGTYGVHVRLREADGRFVLTPEGRRLPYVLVRGERIRMIRDPEAPEECALVFCATPNHGGEVVTWTQLAPPDDRCDDFENLHGVFRDAWRCLAAEIRTTAHE